MYVTGRFFTVIQTAATRPPNIFCNKCYTNYALQSLWTILKVVWNPDMTVCLLYNPSGQQYVTSAILRTYPYMSSLVMYKLDQVIITSPLHPACPPLLCSPGIHIFQYKQYMTGNMCIILKYSTNMSHATLYTIYTLHYTIHCIVYIVYE